MQIPTENGSQRYTYLESTNGTRTYIETNTAGVGTVVTLRDGKAKKTYLIYEAKMLYSVSDWEDSTTDPSDSSDDYDIKQDVEKGYYDIGSQEYYAEAVSYTVTNKKTGKVESTGKMIYCYNGKSYPDYVITKIDDPTDSSATEVFVQHVLSFQTVAPDKYMNFEKIMQDYQNKGYKNVKDLTPDDWDNIYGDGDDDIDF